MVKIGVLGVAGRTGKHIIPQILNSNDLCKLGAVIVKSQSELVGKNIGSLYSNLPANISSIIISDNMEASTKDFDALIDFSTPQATLQALDICKKQGKNMVIATTGFSAEEQMMIQDASKDIAIVQSANMSLGMNNMFNLVQKVSSSFAEYADIDIEDVHHKYKKDAPSGTALKLGKQIADVFNKDNLKPYFATDNSIDNQERTKATIGFSVRRSGNIKGEHKVIFTTDDEILEIRHKAYSRSIFAKGAVLAASFLAKHKSGLFTMNDVLNIN